MAPDEVIFGGNRGVPSNQIKDLYILVNNKIDPSFKVIDDTTVAVAARAVSTVLKREGRNNVLSSYAYAASHGIGYHIAFIDADVPEPSGDPTNQFNTPYMTELFTRGEERGRQPSPWGPRPPLATDPAGSDMSAAAK